MSGDGGSGAAVDFEGIHLDGSMGSARRHHIYKLMLSKMSDEQKISVTARIAKEILGNALEQGNDLHRVCNFPNPEGLDLENHPSYARAFNVLRDALTVLRSKMTRVSRRKDEDASITSTSKRSKVDAIKGELLSKINRTQLIEIMVPILVNLKTALQKNRSPLLKDLMGYLLVVYESYPDKVKDSLSNEPQILLEIEHDARMNRRSKQIRRESIRQ
jgi:condensin-2 complex subunit D3